MSEISNNSNDQRTEGDLETEERGSDRTGPSSLDGSFAIEGDENGETDKNTENADTEIKDKIRSEAEEIKKQTEVELQRLTKLIEEKDAAILQKQQEIADKNRQQIQLDQKRENDMAKILAVIERGPTTSGVIRQPTSNVPADMVAPGPMVQPLQTLPHVEPTTPTPTPQSPFAFVSSMETLANKTFTDLSQQTQSKPEMSPDERGQPKGVCANAANDSRSIEFLNAGGRNVTTDRQERKMSPEKIGNGAKLIPTSSLGDESTGTNINKHTESTEKQSASQTSLPIFMPKFPYQEEMEERNNSFPSTQHGTEAAPRQAGFTAETRLFSSFINNAVGQSDGIFSNEQQNERTTEPKMQSPNDSPLMRNKSPKSKQKPTDNLLTDPTEVHMGCSAHACRIPIIFQQQKFYPYNPKEQFADKWVYNFELTLATYQCYDEGERLAKLCLMLTTNCFEWLQVQHYHQHTFSYNSLRKALIERFGDNRPAIMKFRELDNIKQGNKSVLEYFDDVEAALIHVCPEHMHTPDLFVLDKFEKGLRSDIYKLYRQYIMATKITTINA